MGKIYYFIGPSGSGKDTIVNLIFKIKEKDLNLNRIIPYTSRPIRPGEIDGVEYHFISDEEFINTSMVEHREYNTINGIYRYGTSLKDCDLKNNNYIYIGTIESFDTTKKYLIDNNINANSLCPIYITASDYTRLKRSIDRESLCKKPNYAEVCRRFLSDKEEYTEDNRDKTFIGYDYHKYFYNNEGVILTELAEKILSDIRDDIKGKTL